MMHAADNIEKVRIADLVITINKTEEEESQRRSTSLILLVLVTRRAG